MATEVSEGSRFLKTLHDMPDCTVSLLDRPQPKYIPYSSACSFIYSNVINIKIDVDM